jgi:hypothetical protein
MADILNTGGDASGAAPEGHEQAMLDKVAQKENELASVGGDAPKQEEGQKILGKFNSQEDLEKAYLELERKLSQGNKPEDKPEVKPEEATKEQVEEVVEKAGLNIDDIANNFYETGTISEEHYAALEKAGISREIVDQYVAGQQAQAEKIRGEIFNELGGEDQFNTIVEWAVQNMSKADIERYNRDVDSGDLATVRNAVMSLAYRYEKAVGTEPKLVGGDKGAAGEGFKSLAQLTAAMKDPRYATDPAYRAEVQEKLSRSNIM